MARGTLPPMSGFAGLGQRIARGTCLILLLGVLLGLSGCRCSGGATENGNGSAADGGPAPNATAGVPLRATGAAEPTLSRPGGYEDRTFLWRVKSASSVVYLLGSIHVARADLYPLDGRVEAAFESADALVLEVVLGEAERAEAARKLAAAGTYPAGDSLDRHLEPALLGRVLDRAGAAVGPPAAVKRLEPWFLSQVLLMNELARLGYRDDQGIDRYFQERARGRKRIEALETIDEQVGLLDGMSSELQALMLDETLAELEDLGPTMQAAFAAWKRGDTATLERLLMRSLDDPRYAPLKRRLFGDRNRRMTQHIERRLSAQGTWFVVVGSGHLLGEDGIVSALRKRRFSVEQR